jgi:hypothetical protein
MLSGPPWCSSRNDAQNVVRWRSREGRPIRVRCPMAKMAVELASWYANQRRTLCRLGALCHRTQGGGGEASANKGRGAAGFGSPNGSTGIMALQTFFLPWSCRYRPPGGLRVISSVDPFPFFSSQGILAAARSSGIDIG